MWGNGSDETECMRTQYRGSAPFSEPETRAVRDFVLSVKEQLKFAINFHSYGKAIITPYNAMLPNLFREQHPEIRQTMHEFITEAKFAAGTDIGPATEIIGVVAGGSAGDWIS